MRWNKKEVSLSSPELREIRTSDCSTKVGKKLASIAVHGAERLQGNWLEAVLAFQCAVFGTLAGGNIIIIVIIICSLCQFIKVTSADF